MDVCVCEMEREKEKNELMEIFDDKEYVREKKNGNGLIFTMVFFLFSSSLHRIEFCTKKCSKCEPQRNVCFNNEWKQQQQTHIFVINEQNETKHIDLTPNSHIQDSQDVHENYP